MTYLPDPKLLARYNDWHLFVNAILDGAEWDQLGYEPMPIQEWVYIAVLRTTEPLINFFSYFTFIHVNAIVPHDHLENCGQTTHPVLGNWPYTTNNDRVLSLDALGRGGAAR